MATNMRRSWRCAFLRIGRPDYLVGTDVYDDVADLSELGLNFLGVLQDGEGLVADQLETRLRTLRDNGEPLPKPLFDIPDFHNPTGITMSLERRKRLIKLALEYEFITVQ